MTGAARFCDECGRVLHRVTGRCVVCADDAELRVPVMLGAGARGVVSGAPLMPLRGEPLVTGFEDAADPVQRVERLERLAPKAPFVIPRAALDDEKVVDVLVYDDAIVLSHHGLDGDTAAPEITTVGGHLRRTRHRRENERRTARLAVLPAEQALMTDGRNELFAPRSPDHAELRPTHGGGELVLHLRHHGERRLTWSSRWASVDDVADALAPMFGDLLIRRPPTLSTVGAAALDLVMTVLVVVLLAYLGWSYLVV